MSEETKAPAEQTENAKPDLMNGTPTAAPVKAKTSRKAPAKKKPDAAEPDAAGPEYVMFESRDREPTMFAVAGVKPRRNFSNGRLEFRVRADDVERFRKNHHVNNGRIIRKAE